MHFGISSDTEGRSQAICLHGMSATADKVSDLLCDDAQQFLAETDVCFERESRYLAERVGMNYSPKQALSLFVVCWVFWQKRSWMRLRRELKRPCPAPEHDIPFC